MQVINEYWTNIVENFIKSGLSQKEYARQNDLKVYTLGYYVRKSQTGFNGFIEAKETPVMTVNNDGKPFIDITFNKMKITIYGNYDEELLLNVLRTIKKV